MAFSAQCSSSGGRRACAYLFRSPPLPPQCGLVTSAFGATVLLVYSSLMPEILNNVAPVTVAYFL